MNHELDELTVEEIKQLIRDGVISEELVKWYYRNEWWDETP